VVSLLTKYSRRGAYTHPRYRSNTSTVHSTKANFFNTMRFSSATVLVLLALLAAIVDRTGCLVEAKKPSRPAAAASRKTSGRPSAGRPSGRSPVSRRRDEDEEEEEEEELGFPDELEEEEADEDIEEEGDEDFRPSRKRPTPSSKRGSGPPPSSRSSGKRPPSSASAGSNRKRPPSARPQYEEDYEEDYERPRRSSGGRPSPKRGPPPRGSGGSSRQGRRGDMVAFKKPQPSAFTRGLETLRNSIPDPAVVREAAVNSIKVVRETTSSVSGNLYREVKGLTSSELEQVMLKATRPDDTAVKGKHVERLVGVTYQISSRYDIYDAVLRKLWGKMAEKDWRSTIKALYILHRFSADGAPEHAPSLKVWTTITSHVQFFPLVYYCSLDSFFQPFYFNRPAFVNSAGRAIQSERINTSTPNSCLKEMGKKTRSCFVHSCLVTLITSCCVRSALAACLMKSLPCPLLLLQRIRRKS
jgi:hypothetical protein